MNKEKFIIIAGPCVIESKGMLRQTAETLLEACAKLDVSLVFKSSYKKANRTSLNSFTGLGDQKSLEFLSDIRKEYGIPVLTDVHSVQEVALATPYVDVLQIPAFLCRQTELLVAAGATGKTVNIKKGQFLAPDGMKKAADKVCSTGNKNVWLTERGTFFGYHDLVVDFRSLKIMSQYGFPLIYDATHSLQQPSIGEQSGGFREYIHSLARAAVATGVDGIFFETHPNPEKALSDSATQLPLSDSSGFIKGIVELNAYIKANFL
jgi:2-dehydro-3-deoxyphosphooctonate aldolase (KDO 8-P synthase)